MNGKVLLLLYIYISLHAIGNNEEWKKFIAGNIKILTGKNLSKNREKKTTYGNHQSITI
jgi:hypothetical protein